MNQRDIPKTGCRYQNTEEVSAVFSLPPQSYGCKPVDGVSRQRRAGKARTGCAAGFNPWLLTSLSCVLTFCDTCCTISQLVRMWCFCRKMFVRCWFGKEIGIELAEYGEYIQTGAGRIMIAESGGGLGIPCLVM